MYHRTGDLIDLWDPTLSGLVKCIHFRAMNFRCDLTTGGSSRGDYSPSGLWCSWVQLAQDGRPGTDDYAASWHYANPNVQNNAVPGLGNYFPPTSAVNLKVLVVYRKVLKSYTRSENNTSLFLSTKITVEQREP
jgi:hypothetical protein